MKIDSTRNFTMRETKTKKNCRNTSIKFREHDKHDKIASVMVSAFP